MSMTGSLQDVRRMTRVVRMELDSRVLASVCMRVDLRGVDMFDASGIELDRVRLAEGEERVGERALLLAHEFEVDMTGELSLGTFVALLSLGSAFEIEAALVVADDEDDTSRDGRGWKKAVIGRVPAAAVFFAGLAMTGGFVC